MHSVLSKLLACFPECSKMERIWFMETQILRPYLEELLKIFSIPWSIFHLRLLIVLDQVSWWAHFWMMLAMLSRTLLLQAWIFSVVCSETNKLIQQRFKMLKVYWNLKGIQPIKKEENKQLIFFLEIMKIKLKSRILILMAGKISMILTQSLLLLKLSLQYLKLLNLPQKNRKPHLLLFCSLLNISF